MRTRASGLATDRLGPRTQREIERSRQRETTQDRWTGLDRALSAAARDGVVDLRKVPGDLGRRRHRALLVGRLQYLAQLGLAEKSRGARWTLRPDAERTLRALRSEEHTSELQSLMRISYAVFCLTKKTKKTKNSEQYTRIQ